MYNSRACTLVFKMRYEIGMSWYGVDTFSFSEVPNLYKMVITSSSQMYSKSKQTHHSKLQ